MDSVHLAYPSKALYLLLAVYPEGTDHNLLDTLPPERTQPKKMFTANFSSGTLKTLIDRPLWLKNKKF